MLLLSLSGGRISDLMLLNFSNIKYLLEHNYLGLYVQKDKKHRRVYLKNTFLKENIHKFYLLLLEELATINIGPEISQATPLFFKLKPLLLEKKIVILNKNTVINELNTFLFAACKHFKIIKKIKAYDSFDTKRAQYLETTKYITSHSFRITKISFLIKRIGLYKTMQQIGHAYPNTTLLYNRNMK